MVAKPVVLIAPGDPRGIGPEVVRKALEFPQVWRACRPVVVGNPRLARRVGGSLDSGSAGRISFAWFQKALEWVRRGGAYALVTGPISKEAWRKARVGFLDHTGALRASARRNLAMAFTPGPSFLSKPFLVALATEHLPFSQIPRALTAPRVERALGLLVRALRSGWGCPRPRIAICALNPHAGEGGLLGKEEGRLAGVVRKFRARGLRIFGPLPADSVFEGGAASWEGVLALYHDQATIPLKALWGKGLVQVTLGLPFVRTAPAHGTAFDISGKDLADPTSLREAILLAARLAVFLCTLLAAFSPSLEASSGDKTITVLYTGDTYGVIGYPGFPGGLAKRKWAIEETRKKTPNVLVLDTGNTLAPFYFSRFDRGEFVFNTLDQLGYDAINLGSHDFDYGQNRILSLKAKVRNVQFLSSNIREKTSGKPWAQEWLLKEVQGIRVGILGLCDPKIEQQTIVGNFEGLAAESPKQALGRLIPEIRPKVDLLILLSNIPADHLRNLLEEIKGIDIAISRSAGGLTEYDHYPEPSAHDFRYYMSTQDSGEARLKTLFAYAGRFGYALGKIDVTLRSGKIVGMQPSAIDLPVEYPEDSELKKSAESRIKKLEEEYRRVLIDNLKKRLGRPWTKEDFLHLVLSVMRSASSSEIAVINHAAFFKLEFVNNYISRQDHLELIDLYHLFWTDNHLVKLYLTGRQIRRLAEENQGSPRLQFLGLEADLNSGEITINGRPVKNDEKYTLATSNYLAKGETPWPALTSGEILQEEFGGKNQVLRDLAIQYLQRHGWKREYDGKKVAPYPTQWRLDIEKITLDVSDFDAKRNEPFTQVRDARINASDQFTVGTSGSLGLIMDHSQIRWRGGLEAAFSKVSLPNGVVNNPLDQLLINSQVDLKSLKIPIGFGNFLSPAFLTAYDSEFTPTPANPRRKLWRLQPGLTTTLGEVFDAVNIGSVTEIDFSTRDTNTEHGVSFYSKLRKPWRDFFTFTSEIDFRYFPRTSRDTIDDLLWQGNFRQRIFVPLWGNLSLSPYVDVFAWRGKLIRETGWNLLVGVSLAYSQLWKPQYQKFFR